MLSHIASCKEQAIPDSEKIQIRIDLLNELSIKKSFSFESNFIRGCADKTDGTTKDRL